MTTDDEPHDSKASGDRTNINSGIRASARTLASARYPSSPTPCIHSYRSASCIYTAIVNRYIERFCIAPPAMQKSINAYRDPWQDGRNPVTEGQFRSSLPLLPLPQVPVR